MPRELKVIGPRQVALQTYKDAPLEPEEVRGQGILSGISHGTEMNLYRGTSAFADHGNHHGTASFRATSKAPRPQGRSVTSGSGGSRRSARRCIISNPATSYTC